MITEFTCPCGADKPTDAKYYDGWLGYEAIVCKRCGRYYDHNGEQPADDWSKSFVGLKLFLLACITLMISCSKQDSAPPRCASVTGYSYKYTLDTIPLPSETYIFYKDDNLCSPELDKVIKANQDSSHLFRVCAIDRIERRAYNIHYR